MKHDGTPITAWDWNDTRCVQLYAEAIKKGLRPCEVVEYINKRVAETARITPSVISGERNRKNFRARTIALVGDAECVERFYKAGTNSRRKTKKQVQTTEKKRVIRSRSVAPPVPAPALEVASKPPSTVLSEIDARKERARKLRPLLLENGKPATIMTIEDGMCSYPIGEPGDKDFGLCGRAVNGKEPYCGDHQCLTRQPKSKKSKEKDVGTWLNDQTAGQAQRTSKWTD